MGKHAYLSASASHRWLKCPPSAKLCAMEEDRSSPYAQQGTDAHELCQYLLEKALGRETVDPTENLTWYDAEMQEAAEGYRDFVMDLVAQYHSPLVCVEQVLDFSRWVEHGFGTADALIISDGILHVVDFKYGLGQLVKADGDDGTGNSQMKCYALGGVATFEDLYDFDRIRLSIYQPRRENISTFEMSKEDLLRWADEVLAPTAKLAYDGEGEFCAGDHCIFCKAKANCRKRAEENLTMAKYDFVEASTLSADEIAEILPKIELLTAWADDIKNFALSQALSGTRYPGFKVVEGRSTRKYRNEAEVARIVSEAGYDPFERKLMGITAMTKQLGKQKFETLLAGQLIRPQGKPVLVPETDERPEFSTAANDFMED